jgi:hypothetical protein
VVGKRAWGNGAAPVTIATLVPPVQNTTLVVRDDLSGADFLVDTGADVSVLPYEYMGGEATCSTTPPLLRAANGSPIATKGCIKRWISVGGHRYKQKFVVANVDRCILGADFLRQRRLLVDLYNAQLVRPGPWTTVPARRGGGLAAGVRIVTPHTPFADLLDTFPALTTMELILPPVGHSVVHTLDVEGPPFRMPFRNLNPEKLEVVRREFESLVKLGGCRRGRGQWASPLHMVAKADKTWRPCGDYVRLNQ